MILALLLFAFVGGALLMAWASQNWRTLGGAQSLTGAVQNGADPLQNSSGGVDGNSAAASGVVAPSLVDAQTSRILDLEQRLSRISASAQAASYNANRAEALLTAFAARRALDAGRPLGYIEGTLRLRFGDAQPKAVATIINAAAEPVTLSDLRVGLMDIDAVVRDQRTGSGNWFQGFWREIGSLAILRKSGGPSPEPEQRLARARHAVELGQIDSAITEMSALPPQASVTRWLELARRYNEAHRALDVVEAAAILETRSTPGTVSTPVVVPDQEDAVDNAAAVETAPVKARE
ncbi:MAG TPA: hypothetical protein VF475_13295 [Sphingobium sp.]